MDILTLIKSGLGLVAILGVLVFLLILPSKKTKSKKQKVLSKKTDTIKNPIDLQALRGIIKNKNISQKELQVALDDVIKYFGTIPKKLGTRNHPDLLIYEDIIYSLCRHPKVSSKMVVEFISSLEKKNESYKAPINDALTKGLNSRVM